MVHRVVLELTESASGKAQIVLGNIHHLLTELGAEGAEIELVAHSDGIVALYRRRNAQTEAIDRLATQGVRFLACRTTMKSRGLTEEDILPVAQVVPSGITEVVRRQEEGWCYVRP